MGRKIATMLVLVLLVPFVLFAQTGQITGTVLDKDTKDALPGANVTLKGTPRGTSTNLEGKFNLSIPAGTYTVQVSMVGYGTFQKQVTVAADATVELNAELVTTAIEQSAVEVTANRAVERETPVAFSNVSGDAIKRAYAVEDPVGLIKMVPNVYAYSEGGAGMGDTNVKVRGFDQERVQVMINGIAVNDPESQKVYWSNWAGLSGSTKDIQVQRGTGSSLYGTSAFGGSINVETMDYSPNAGGSVKYSTGSYGTYNAAVNYNTGLLLNNHASFGVNLERKFGNAFRQGSWVRRIFLRPGRRLLYRETIVQAQFLWSAPGTRKCLFHDPSRYPGQVRGHLQFTENHLRFQ